MAIVGTTNAIYKGSPRHSLPFFSIPLVIIFLYPILPLWLSVLYSPLCILLPATLASTDWLNCDGCPRVGPAEHGSGRIHRRQNGNKTSRRAPQHCVPDHPKHRRRYPSHTFDNTHVLGMAKLKSTSATWNSGPVDRSASTILTQPAACLEARVPVCTSEAAHEQHFHVFTCATRRGCEPEPL